MKQPSSATLVLLQAQRIERWLNPEDWYTLVERIAGTIATQDHMREYDALQYAAQWLRGETKRNDLGMDARTRGCGP